MRDYATDFDHVDVDFPAHQDAVLDELRDTCPVARGQAHGGFWVFTRYQDIHAAAKDFTAYSSADGITIPSFGAPPARPAVCDPPEALAYRAFLWQHFKPAAVSNYEGMITAVVRGLLDSLDLDAEVDLAQVFAIPIPAIVIAHILGLPTDRVEQMVDWSNRCFERGDPEAIRALLAYLEEHLEQRRRQPAEDLLSAIAQAEINGRPIPDDHALSTTMLVASAGFETTGNAIGFLLAQLGSDRGLRNQVIADPGCLPAVIEESLRMDPPLLANARTLTCDQVVAGKSLRKGDRVLLWWHGANHDERQFENPAVFDHARPSNRHLSFGHGVHHCLGADLARTEIRIAVTELLRRHPDFEVVRAPTVVHRSSLRALDSLVVRLAPEPRERG